MSTEVAAVCFGDYKKFRSIYQAPEKKLRRLSVKFLK